MFDSVYSIALDILGKIGGDTSKRYLSTYDIALAILGVLGGDTTKKFDSVYSILLDIYRARFGSALSGMDSSYSILEEINKSFDPSDTTHYDSSYSILVSIDSQPGLIGHVFSIVTDAANTVIINGVETRSISVREGENVVWSVERRGYVSQNGTYTMGGEDYTETVTLVKEQYTFSIVATPVDATVTINGEVRSSITADYGTSITWEVSKEGYTTQSNTETLTGDTTRNITLTEVQYVFTIVPTPADATVMINGVQQSSVTVSDGTTLTWEVSKTGYTTQTGSYTIAGADHTENVTLASTQAVITFDKGDSAVKLVVNGEYLGTSSPTHTVTVDPGTQVHWEAYRAGYATRIGDFNAQPGETTVSTSLSPAPMVAGTATANPLLYHYNGSSVKKFNTTYNSPVFYSSETTIGSELINSRFATLKQIQKLRSLKFEACQPGKFGGVENPLQTNNNFISSSQTNIESVSWDGAAPESGTTFKGLNSYFYEDTYDEIGASQLRRPTIPTVYMNNCDFSNLTTLIDPAYVYAYEGNIDGYPNRTKDIFMNCWDNVPASATIYPIHTTYLDKQGSTKYVSRQMAYDYIRFADINVYAYGWTSANIETLKSYFKIHTYSSNYWASYYNYGIEGIGIICIWIDEKHYWYWSLEEEYPDVNALWGGASSGGSRTFNCTQWSLVTVQ